MTRENKRTELPYKGEIQTVSVWKILSKFIGQELSRVSLPVILNEPLSALQKNCEMLCLGHELYDKAAVEDDPVRRIVLAACGNTTLFATTKVRNRKPFNPMLGETYEMVTDKFRFVAEKV